jgi:hypothetical protein
MQETAFVCLEEGNISFYAAIRNHFRWKNIATASSSALYGSGSIQFGSLASGLRTIENTYASLI